MLAFPYAQVPLWAHPDFISTSEGRLLAGPFGRHMLDLRLYIQNGEGEYRQDKAKQQAVYKGL